MISTAKKVCRIRREAEAIDETIIAVSQILMTISVSPRRHLHSALECSRVVSYSATPKTSSKSSSAAILWLISWVISSPTIHSLEVCNPVIIHPNPFQPKSYLIGLGLVQLLFIFQTVNDGYYYWFFDFLKIINRFLTVQKKINNRHQLI